MTTTPTEKRMYILYDGRACGGGDTDDAAVLDTADTLKEARRAAQQLGYACACYSCPIKQNADGSEYVDNNENRWEFDYEG